MGTRKNTADIKKVKNYPTVITVTNPDMPRKTARIYSGNKNKNKTRTKIPRRNAINEK